MTADGRPKRIGLATRAASILATRGVSYRPLRQLGTYKCRRRHLTGGADFGIVSNHRHFPYLS